LNGGRIHHSDSSNFVKMKTTAQPTLIELLTCFRLGEITAEIECRPSSSELLTTIKESIKDIRNQYSLEEINKLAVITSARDAYKKTGNDPSRYRPSAEALLRRIVKGSDLYMINNTVDTLNLVSIQSGYSIGGYDRDKLDGVIEIGIGSKDEGDICYENHFSRTDRTVAIFTGFVI